MDWLPVGIALVYTVAGVGYWASGQRGLGVTYLFYAGANAGLVWAALEGRS